MLPPGAECASMQGILSAVYKISFKHRLNTDFSALKSKLFITGLQNEFNYCI